MNNQFLKKGKQFIYNLFPILNQRQQFYATKTQSHKEKFRSLSDFVAALNFLNISLIMQHERYLQWI